MNRSIVRLFGVVILLFAVLIVWTSRWTVFSATALNNNPLNQLAVLRLAEGQARRDPADDGDGAGQVGPAGGRHLEAGLPDRVRCSRRRSATTTPQEGQHAGLEWSRNDAAAGAAERASRACSARSTAPRRSATTSTRRSTRRPRSWPRTQLLDRAALGLGRRDRAADRRGQGHVLEPDLQRQRPERHVRAAELQPAQLDATAGTAVRRARPSSSSPRPRRSTPASTRPTR